MIKFLFRTFIFGLAVSSGLVLANTQTGGFQSYMRDGLSLNGEWKAIVDPYENGYYNYRYESFDKSETPSRSAFFTDSKMNSPTDLIEYDFDKSLSITVPGDWNTQFEKLYYYEGSVWYRKLFDAPKNYKEQRTFVHFAASNYRSDVYLNGKKLGVHLGGFTPFYFEITDKLDTKNNSLVLKIDNKRSAEGVPTLNTDWWNYGGITRDVNVYSVPYTFIRDYKISLDDHNSKQISVDVWLDGEKNDIKNKKIRFQIKELGISQAMYTDADGRAKLSVSASELSLWSPNNPKQYRVSISSGKDQVVDDIGFRTIKTLGKRLLLNGEDIFLRGISIHEEYAAEGGGRVKDRASAKKLIAWAKELNANFIRLAHYPHSEHMVREAEAQGLLVWSEIPVYWTIHWDSEDTYQNAESQLAAMINRDKNRAAVIIWSLANETPVSDARNRFLKRLADKAKSLDSTRLLSAAMEKHGNEKDPNVSHVEDPLADWVDIVSFNQYLGWYYRTPDAADDTSWVIKYDKPVFVSEFGGGALAGYHGDKGTIWTEEHQEHLYSKTLAMLERIKGFVGTSPWILADFRSPRRLLVGVQDDFNRKGVVSETGVKKKSFYVLQEFYNKKENSEKLRHKQPEAANNKNRLKESP